MAFFPEQPNVNIPQQQTPYTSPFASDSPISQLIGQLGQYLAPQQQFSEALPYETYAAPSREAFNIWETDVYRPEFEYQTMDPFNKQYSNMAATSGLSQMGSAPDRYEYARRMTEQPYQNQLMSAQNAYEDMLTGGYRQELQDFYQSPTAYTNIGM